ncbi:glycosyltransferase [Kluyvera cryocrescens]|uniref:glycosyltransferase n=1 Tax=Kluyvera cryocrescens TaxID=580 RepID=UPI00224A4CE0|nr:glycosyltransferase [Kluyvera cryocrescens]MCX2869417.1 glycosyltransferase [Kluyvera cryocrescens]HDG1675106.1 glycosyltransferase [Kluyvera cryocrescens]
MKIVLLSGASSVHTVRWANGLSSAGHDVSIISQHPPIDPFLPSVKVYLLPFRGVLGYFIMVPKVRELLNEIKPDIVNAHYASGYGTTARLVGYHPWVLSVWGSDIYDFPLKSLLHRWLVKKNLRAADRIASTSYCMADQTRTLTPEIENIEITPFGVDLDSYKTVPPINVITGRRIVIGTVKTMKPKYGIDTLIKAYAILISSLKEKSVINAPELELRLVGGGEQFRELSELAESLGVASSVKFIGQVPHASVPHELSQMDIYVALSRLDSESFGVAILEAGAAGRPVVVSDAGGLPEVTVDGETGIVVPRENPKAAALALEKLVLNSSLRQDMGMAGKKHVSEKYSWDECINTMIDVYNDTISRDLAK